MNSVTLTCIAIPLMLLSWTVGVARRVYSAICSGNKYINKEKSIPLYYNIKELAFSREGEKKQKIPLIIHQTSATSLLSPAYYAATVAMINMNKEYDYRFYTDSECKDFIKNNFDATTLAAYDMLIPGAFKSDIFRLCVLYIYGGVYIDCKSTTIFPFRDFIPVDSEFAICRDFDNWGLYNGFMAAIPRHPFILTILKEIVKTVFREDYGKSPLDVTGPHVLGRLFRKYFCKNGDIGIEQTVISEENGKIDIIGRLHCERGYQYLCDKKMRPLINRVNSDYEKRWTNSYGLRWFFGCIYR